MFLAALVGLVGFGDSKADAGGPPDGVYDIAVIQDDNNAEEWTDDDFAALSSAPGIFAFPWQVIQPSSLTSAGLAEFDVLVMGYNQKYEGLTDDIAAAIVAFVQSGGTLVVPSFDFDGPDSLLEAFGPEYEIVWIDNSGDTVTILDPAHPLASTPNALTNARLSDWGSSLHALIVSAGSAWNMALHGVGDEEDGSPEGLVAGCAPFGQGTIVVNGLDPEFHGTNNDPSPAEAYLVIENQITAGLSDVCMNPPPRRNLGGALARLLPPALNRRVRTARRLRGSPAAGDLTAKYRGRRPGGRLRATLRSWQTARAAASDCASFLTRKARLNSSQRIELVA